MYLNLSTTIQHMISKNKETRSMWRKNLRRKTCFFIGIWVLSHQVSLLAPACSNKRTISSWPIAEATCKGDLPLCVVASISTLDSMSNLATSKWPNWSATWSEVSKNNVLTLSFSTLWSSNKRVISTDPRRAAPCKGVKPPSRSALFLSAPYFSSKETTSTWPAFVASCKGLRPEWPCISMSAS